MKISQSACTDHLVDRFDIASTSAVPECSSVELRSRWGGEGSAHKGIGKPGEIFSQ